MDVRLLKQAPWVLLLAVLFAPPAAAQGHHVDVTAAREKAEQLRRQDDHAAFVQLRDWYHRMTPYEAQQLEPGGPLEAAIAIGGDEGLDLAAEVMKETRGNPDLFTLDDAVTNAIQKH